jgi:hypothetical protein
MKKAIIILYFSLSIFMSFAFTHTAIFLRLDDKDVNYRERHEHLSENEIMRTNQNKEYSSQIDPNSREVIRVDETIEVREKTLFGWETKIDTTKTYIKERN